VLDDLARLQLGLCKAKAELLPDPLFRPGVHRLVGADLEVEPADLRRSHAVEREAALMVGVNELVGCRWGPCQDAEPGKGMGSLIGGGWGVPEGRAGDAMRAIAAGHEVTVEGCLLAVAPVGDPGVVIVDASDRCRLGLEPDLATVH